MPLKKSPASILRSAEPGTANVHRFSAETLKTGVSAAMESAFTRGFDVSD